MRSPRPVWHESARNPSPDERIWAALPLPALVSADWRRAQRIGRGALRIGLVGAVLLAGVALAASTLPLAHMWAE